jgi:hypothetical protein
MFVLKHVVRRILTLIPVIGFGCCLLSGCAEMQMGYNVLTFDTAVADTANQQLLLNAVRASQRYPKSFTSVGEVLGSPPISGSLASQLNFSALAGMAGLRDYSVSPSITANAGYGSLGLKNLNANEFMIQIRKTIPDPITKSFEDDRDWPRQLLELIYIQSLRPSEQQVRFVDSARKTRCAIPDLRCEKIAEQVAEYSNRCDQHFNDPNVRMRQFQKDPDMYYNTATNYCHYERFRIFLEEMRVVRLPSCTTAQQGCVRKTPRSALHMIGYLGELIAAQNYIAEPYIPRILIGTSIGSEFRFFDVPLFVVRRGVAAEGASVAVVHQGVTYYVPRPEFGSPDEARSMQVLDLVLQTVQAATMQKDLPKTVPTIGIVSAK